MKKYFFKKTLGWYILTGALCLLVEIFWILLMIAVSSMAPDLITKKHWQRPWLMRLYLF